MAKKFAVDVMPEEVVHTDINKSKGGYNSARIVAKKGDKEYMSINYEWEGDHVPSFAMDLMSFMTASEMEIGTTVKEEDFKELSSMLNDEEEAKHS